MDQLETLPFNPPDAHTHPADWKAIEIEEKGCEFQHSINLSSAKMVGT